MKTMKIPRICIPLVYVHIAWNKNDSNMKAVRGQITCVFTVQLFVKIDENKNPDNI
jgi:hypothetical protein